MTNTAKTRAKQALVLILVIAMVASPIAYVI
jgi:hypothetical protein